MRDDWRIRIEPREATQAETLLERLGLDLGSDEAKRLARELEGHRLAVSRDGDTLFVYAESQAQAEQARQGAGGVIGQHRVQQLHHPAAGVDSDRRVPHANLFLCGSHMREREALDVRAPETPTLDVDNAAIGQDQHGGLAARDAAVTHIEHLLTRFQKTREHRHLAARGLACRARQV